MTLLNSPLRRASLGLLAAGSLLAAGTSALAQTPFGEIDRASEASVRFAASESNQPILAGGQVSIAGEGFQPGQQVDLLYGTTSLTGGPLVADGEGKLSGTIAIPAGAVSGTHPILVVAQAPYYATVAELKVSPTVPLAGAEAYRIDRAEVVRGLYQSAYSPKNDALFAAAAIGRPPVRESELVKLSPQDLSVQARVTPAAVEGREGVYAVYGLGIDDAHDNLWVTNTRQNTVAVYSQGDLSLVKQFPQGTVNHARDVVVDQELGKAYASAAMTPNIVVFDTASLEQTKEISISALRRGEEFSTLSLSLDPQAHKLYVAGLSTNEVAVIDTQADEVEKVFPVPGARGVIGISHDPQTGRIYVAAQGSDNLVVLDGTSGAVVADTPIGAGALNVAFDPVTRHAYVSSRGAGTITVTDADGAILANLGPAPLANHVALGKDGVVYAVDKSAGVREADNDVIKRIEPLG